MIYKILKNFWRYFWSPFWHLLAGPGSGCRFDPGCGEYFFTAWEEKGFLRGFSLGIKRLSRCHPWSR